MIVRDSADMLEETLGTIAPIADELLIVNTGSDDATLSLIEKYSAKTLTFEWADDFSAARNFTMEHATEDWILWLDAGETIDAEETAALKQFIANEASPDSAYAMLVCTPSENQFVTEQVARVRLIPRLQSIRFAGRINENVLDSLEQAGLTLDGIPWRIKRSSRDLEITVKQAKAERDLVITELAMAEMGEVPSLLCRRGEAFQALNRPDEAVDSHRRALAASENESSDKLESYYGLLASLELTEQGREMQLKVCLEATEMYPLDAQLLCALGGYLQRLGRLTLATRAYETAFRFGKVNPMTWHMTNISEMAAFCCGLAMQLQRLDDEAVTFLDEAITMLPESIRLRRMLIEIHTRNGRREEALKAASQLRFDSPHAEVFRNAVRGACLAAQKDFVPALQYLETAYEAGCRDPYCLRWLSIVKISGQDWDGAQDTLQQWRDIEPENGEVQKYLEIASKQSAVS